MEAFTSLGYLERLAEVVCVFERFVKALERKFSPNVSIQHYRMCSESVLELGENAKARHRSCVRLFDVAQPLGALHTVQAAR